MQTEHGSSTPEEDALYALDNADRALANITPRHGCIYKPLEEMCIRCTAITRVRQAIASNWIALGGNNKSIWWAKQDERKE